MTKNNGAKYTKRRNLNPERKPTLIITHLNFGNCGCRRRINMANVRRQNSRTELI